MRFKCDSCSQVIKDDSIKEGASFNCPSCNSPGEAKSIGERSNDTETLEEEGDIETGGEQVMEKPAGWQVKYKKMRVYAIAILLLVVVTAAYQLFFKMSPAEKIVYGMEQVEEIMESNMKTPEEGVDQLIEYFEDYGPEAVELLVQTSIDATNISGDGDREEYINEVSEEISEAAESLTDVYQKFVVAVSADKAAQSRLEKYAKRWEDVFDEFSSLNL